MKRILLAASALALLHCGSGDSGQASHDGDGGGSADVGSGASGPGSSGVGAANGTGEPKTGEPGCGFELAAFCDTFDGTAKFRGRGGELDSRFWSAGRMQGQASTTRAMGIGMAVIPHCRAGVGNHVWPDFDALICDPTPEVASDHLLVAVAAQNYGQNGYRIRQPFDFAGRTGKIAFDGIVSPMSPLHGWFSLAVTDEPISMPGYSIVGNDEGTIIPRNAVEVHFMMAPGDVGITVRHVHVFENYVDTAHEPPQASIPAPHQLGKMNHFEVDVADGGIEVRITPYSEDGKKFAAPTFIWKLDASLPFSRGYVQLSVHNHATIKYTQSDSTFPSVVDAAVARIDNIGFDGPVIDTFREYEVPDALVKFSEPNWVGLPDPENPESIGYDIGYILQDAAIGPTKKLRFQDVDTSGVTRARLSFSAWMDFFLREGFDPKDFTFRARLNGKGWLDRRLTAEEAAFLTEGPTTVDSSGKPMGDPGSQGRFALTLDVPIEDLVDGDNTVEFVTAHVPTILPPLVCNIDLVLGTE